MLGGISAASVPAAAMQPEAQAHVVAEARHLRHRHAREHRRIDDRRARRGAERGRRHHRRHGEPAAQVAEPHVGGAEEIRGDRRHRGEGAHQDEERNHRQREGVGGAERDGADLRERRIRPHGEVDADESSEAERHADVHSEREPQEQQGHHDPARDLRRQEAPCPISSPPTRWCPAALRRAACVRCRPRCPARGARAAAPPRAGGRSAPGRAGSAPSPWSPPSAPSCS